jgi:putative oxidoreductase
MTRDQKIYRAAHLLASVIIGLLLLSGYPKLLYPADFALAVYRFHLVPEVLVNAVAIYLPWLEAVCAVCLWFVPKYRVAALWIVLVLLAVFTSAIAINLLRGSAFGCGCFGSSSTDTPMSWMNVARNVGLVLLALLALVAAKKRR